MSTLEAIVLEIDVLPSKAYGAISATDLLQSLEIQRREPGPQDIVIKIAYCGICHSDIHTVRSEWGPASYPCVPGHEIVGQVIQVGKKVKKFKLGDHAGVGCYVDSCGKCIHCKNNEEQFCVSRCVYTYNSLELDGKTPTQGGYSSIITVREKFALKVKKSLPLDRVAPLLCAGITTYSPLKRYKVRKGKLVGVVGLGGLGHIAIKLASAMGAEVVVFSTSPKKKLDVRKLGGRHFVMSKDLSQFEAWTNKLDLILDTVSAPHDFSPYLSALKPDGTLVLLGASPLPNEVSSFSLIMGRKNLTGSLIGGLKETQEMLDFCARQNVLADIELIPASRINEAYERTIKGNVKYRFVIDTNTL